MNAALILYDGVCGLCNGMVQVVLPRDRRRVFTFVSLQSAKAHDILAQFGRSAAALDTFYVIDGYGGRTPVLLEKSRAAFAVARGLCWWWLAPLRLVPRWVSDRIYDFVAKRRYRWFGKHDSCPLPKPEYRDRFLE